MGLKASFLRSCVLTLAFAASAQAQETTDTIIVVGGRLPVASPDMTSAVSIVDEADISLRGSGTLADTLRAVSGIAVSRSGVTGGLTDLRVRGSEANHVLVLIDGLEVSAPLIGGFDFAHAAGYGVERVEVLRGEQSALWGSDAIGGVINIQSVGSSDADRLGILLETGSFETFTAGGQYAATAGRASGGMSLSHYQTEGIDVSGSGGETDGYSRFSATTTGRFRLREDESIQWSARFVDFESEFDSDSDFNGLLDDTLSTNAGRQSAAGLRYTRGAATVRHDLAINATQDLLESYDAGEFLGETEGRRFQAFYQPTISWQMGEFSHRLTGLAELEREEFESFAGAGAESNQSREIDNRAAALDYRVSRGPVRISASLRQDWNDSFEDAATWRLGAAWVFDRFNGRFRASLGEGVKNPGIYELYGFFPGFFTGNPDLQPERSRSWEVGWDQTLSRIAQLSVTYFEADLQDEIFTDFSVFPSTARNRPTQSERAGVELEMSADLSPQLALSASATFLASEENGVPEIRRPETTGSVAVNWRSADSTWQVGLAADHVGDQLDTEFVTFSTITLPAYTLVSARVAWQVTPAAQLYLRGTNLGNEEVIDVFGYASEGRGFYVGLRLGG